MVVLSFSIGTKLRRIAVTFGKEEAGNMFRNKHREHIKPFMFLNSSTEFKTPLQVHVLAYNIHCLKYCIIVMFKNLKHMTWKLHLTCQ